MLAFLLTLALAQAPLTGIVKDPSGAAVPGATVTIRTDSGPAAQTVTGPDGRFTFDRDPLAAQPLSSSPAASHKRNSLSSRARWKSSCLRPSCSRKSPSRRRAASSGSATRRRASPWSTASRSAVGGRCRRRCPAAGPDFQPVPAHQQPRRASDDAGRVAARHRPERRQPDAGADRRRAVQRSVRRLGVLDPRAARERRPDRGGRRLELEPLRQLRDGRRHQHRHQPRRAAHRGAQRAVRQPRHAEDRLLRQRRLAATSVSRSKAASSTPTAIPVVGAGARPDRHERHRRATGTSAPRSITTRRATSARSSASGYFREERDNAKISDFPEQPDDSRGK